MIQVAIVEDIREIKEGLELLIDSSEGFRCIKTYSNAEEAMEDLPLINPDVVLMDINLPGINGIEAVRSLKPKIPATQFIMSTVYEDDENIFESLKAGASGYLLKKTAPSKILESITEVFNGGSPMSSQIASKVVAAFQNNSLTASTGVGVSLDVLSKRENEILEMLSTGLLYKEISDKLLITTETVRKHVYHIYEKLHVTNRVEAVNKYFGR